MIIAHIHHTYYPVLGGIERAIQRVAEEQARLGHEVHVITSAHGAEERPGEEVLSDVYIHRIRAIRIHYPDLTYPIALKHIRRVLRNADVLHAHSQNSLFSLALARVAKDLGARVAMHFMAVRALRDHPSILIRVFGSIYGEYAVRRGLEVSSLRLTRSLRDLEILRSVYNVSEVHYVPDGIDEELLRMPNIGEEFRVRYRLGDDIVLFIGRLHPLKGIEVLLRAIPYVVKERPNTVFVIIGPGDVDRYKSIAERLGVRDKVLFLGFIDEHTKISAIDASTCVVLPSISDYVEVYPMVISEARARGKPIIASAVGGVPYRVKHMVNGILVPPRNPIALARAIIKVVEDKDLASKLGSEGRKELKTWREIASTLLDLYRDV